MITVHVIILISVIFMLKYESESVKDKLTFKTYGLSVWNILAV